MPGDEKRIQERATVKQSNSRHALVFSVVVTHVQTPVMHKSEELGVLKSELVNDRHSFEWS